MRDYVDIRDKHFKRFAAQHLNQNIDAAVAFWRQPKLQRSLIKHRYDDVHAQEAFYFCLTMHQVPPLRVWLRDIDSDGRHPLVNIGVDHLNQGAIYTRRVPVMQWMGWMLTAVGQMSWHWPPQHTWNHYQFQVLVNVHSVTTTRH